MKQYALLLAVLAMLLPISAVAKDTVETPYERILRTSTIRCGYTIWNPTFGVDAKTGEKVGIFHDIMEEMGKRLDLKIVWQEELGWGTILESVKNGRVDMACAGYWLTPPRIKNALSSMPQIYSPLYVWVRQDDARIHSIDDLNSERFSWGSRDRSAEVPLVSKRFPKAKTLSLPELASTPDLIMNLITKKTDFLVADIPTMNDYIANNPGKVRNAFPDQPIILYPNVMLLPPGDLYLKDVIDNMLKDIEYDGTLDAILKKYHAEHDYLRNPAPVSRQ